MLLTGSSAARLRCDCMVNDH